LIKKIQYLRFSEHNVGITDGSDSAKKKFAVSDLKNDLFGIFVFPIAYVRLSPPFYPQTFAENLIAGLSMQLRETELPCPEELFSA
jgi:hypothetical protein